MPIIPPWISWKRNPCQEYYRMSCAQCDFDRKYELAKNYVVWRNPECDHSNDPEIVEELPKDCPKCGAKLKKEKLPAKIWY